jgi:hypothetical protein
MGFLKKLTADQRLKTNIPTKAPKSYPAILKIVKLVTTGCGVIIRSAIIIPREIPTAKLESRTIKLCITNVHKLQNHLVSSA